MIHAAKIDENYTDKEKKIIKETLTKLSNNEDLDKLISEAETKEADSNHIQDFTKNIKAMDKNDKIEIIKNICHFQVTHCNSFSLLISENFLCYNLKDLTF